MKFFYWYLRLRLIQFFLPQTNALSLWSKVIYMLKTLQYHPTAHYIKSRYLQGPLSSCPATLSSPIPYPHWTGQDPFCFSDFLFAVLSRQVHKTCHGKVFISSRNGLFLLLRFQLSCHHFKEAYYDHSF